MAKFERYDIRSREQATMPSGPAIVDHVIDLLRSMEEDERMAVFAKFCTHCGANNPRCQCWNDE